jgi:hypothetical protein
MGSHATRRPSHNPPGGDEHHQNAGSLVVATNDRLIGGRLRVQLKSNGKNALNHQTGELQVTEQKNVEPVAAADRPREWRPRASWRLSPRGPAAEVGVRPQRFSMNWRFNLTAGILLVPLFASAAFGRLIENWPYQRLFKESDLVVIATAYRAEDASDRLKTDWKVDLLGMNTHFKIQSTLKGKIAAETITVLHYRPPEGMLFANGPLLVTIRTEEPFVKGKGKETMRPEYLLFLRARPDGRFEPVSGQIDPALSVRELQSSDSFLIDKRGR